MLSHGEQGGRGEEEEEEELEKKRKLWFESVEILISAVDETRDRGKRVTCERGEREGGMRVFHPHRFHHHNATDPVPVSDIKWSRACKLSHSVAEAPILASTLLAQKRTNHSS